MEEKTKANSLLSNISPPSALPNFLTPVTSVSNDDIKTKEEPFITTTFSPAIPQNFNNMAPIEVPESKVSEPEIPNKKEGEQITSEENTQSVESALDAITQGASFLGWMKEAMPANILQKVAETAKSSVDSLVTTLDPQMKEYIYSGGQTEIFVASDKEDKIRPIREAFQEVFGRATVIGKAAQAKNIANQPIGFEAGLLACQERIADVRSSSKDLETSTIVALENILVEILPNQWFDVGFLFLADPEHNVNIKTLTQMTPIPEYIITNLKADTAADYQFKDTGFSTTIGQQMSTNLNVHHSEWHKAYTGVPRSQMILNAARSIAFMYKHNDSNKKVSDVENVPS